MQGRAARPSASERVVAASLLGRHDVPLDFAAISQAAARAEGGEAAAGAGDAPPDRGAGATASPAADMTRTNTLLEQILDEMRRSKQATYVASARSVQPER